VRFLESGYFYLLGAIAAEVVATLSLRASDGFSQKWLVLVLVVGYVTAFVLLSQSLERGVPLGLAYGIWAAVGIAAVAILSIPLFGESITAIQGFGLALIILGVLALELGTSN
jgi:small multidrug resistance pump